MWEEEPEKSDRQIAAEIGVSQPTVSAQRKNLSDKNGQIGQFYQQESRAPVSVFNPTPREKRALRDERVVERMQETGSSSPVRTK